MADFLKQHFFVKTIVQTKLADGYEIVITTDVPCHLWMRWSTQNPWIHSIPSLRRGIEIHGDVYFCFTVYKDNEQEEAGDTLTHTFIKHDWPHCETRYFYFTGDIEGNPVVSTTAIFKKHFEFVAIPEEITIDADHESIYWPVVRATWPLAWGLATTGGFENVNLLYTRAYHWAGAYNISRNCLRFDTSPIPLTATILEAHLDLYPTTARNYGDSKLYILHTPAHEWESGYVGEYGDVRAYVNPASEPVVTNDIPENEYSSFEFNDLGKSMIGNAINLTGEMTSGTIVPIRMRHDVLNIVPGLEATSGGAFFHSGSTHASPPRLYVKYLV